MLWLILLVVVILALGGGAWSYPSYGYAGFSPLLIILVIVLLLWAFGVLR